VRLNCLLLSHDPAIQHAVAQVFAGIDLEFKEDTISAFELLSRSHFDAFIVDCDALEHGTEIIPGIRSSRANRRSVIFTIVNGTTSMATAMELGSNFVMGKPLDIERLSTYFQSALHQMETEHRRYFRHAVALDAEVLCRDGKVIPARLLNASEGGLALRLLDREQLDGSVTIRFALRNAQQTIITAVAVLCWSREPIFGMKLFGVDEESRRAYAEWLSSLPVV
jgi:DNA-binding response OmpR family regulator